MEFIQQGFLFYSLVWFYFALFLRNNSAIVLPTLALNYKGQRELLLQVPKQVGYRCLTMNFKV